MSLLTAHAVKIIPFFTSPHLSSLLAFYRTYLPDFTISAHPADSLEPTFASIAAGPGAAANIYIVQDTAQQRARGSCMLMLDSLGILGELHARLGTAAAQEGLLRQGDAVEEWTGKPTSGVAVSAADGLQTAVLGPLEDKPWGYRQFDLVDLHGNMIVFFAFLDE
ncbi:uncharacterized protein Z519_10098 [Cladophialophora bantiana CBS 173.52]|uniref:Glyoxalase/fosfomycin resistance/dioxygenase domain-containing protein n=1 Tax=Cladophialophora bantiana (strain ATCC 10958 / CBS 173.52 / CDC B-1940 / NIH 8579) TaxID=1442370 RepID=A0A0D2HEJ9_CLAB1|nr:uncharacterized protein Z519_10098 [Cladophialophora bantiana CBS 173.52]KIW89245.1 hypothetical protein Z519_10098 [Cladophialophora bantiana CBS 173.52]